ncbi:hypothetical protein [Halopiger aswanensis]|uniref:Uncharacterized protein n=1 Tax=Halopiger aswanensis TaxID=148449 RepID=A0A419WHA3_9EURY|nr:hypothetical protein [Halopiger aswanensis]RKD94742.1 hypothetical protein ATJ93_1584 [Halopiger aswanensis]
MTVAENRERGHYVETAACDRWPLERVDDDRAEWHDLEFVQDLVGDRAGVIATAGEVAEAKSCYETYDGRAGRWWIRRENHERLVGVDGWYILVVLERESDEILRIALTRAATVDRIIDGNWWECGNGGRSAEQYRQIAWTAVFDGVGGEWS